MLLSIISNKFTPTAREKVLHAFTFAVLSPTSKTVDLVGDRAEAIPNGKIFHSN